MQYRENRPVDNFTQVSNVPLRDSRLSLRAKGLLAYLLSMPPDWSYNAKEIAAHSADGRDSVAAGLRELERYGYLERVQHRQGGKMAQGSDYHLIEAPHPQDAENAPRTDLPETATPETESPLTGTPLTANPTLLIKNNTNTDFDKESAPPKNPKHKYGLYNNVLLSDNDMSKLMEEFPNDYEARIERLSEYVASSGKKYKNHLATIRSWARTDDAKKGAEQPPGRQFLNFDDDGSW